MIAAAVLAIIAAGVLVGLVLTVRHLGNAGIDRAGDQFASDLALQEIVDRARRNPRIAELRGRYRARHRPEQ